LKDYVPGDGTSKYIADVGQALVSTKYEISTPKNRIGPAAAQVAGRGQEQTPNSSTSAGRAHGKFVVPILLCGICILFLGRLVRSRPEDGQVAIHRCFVCGRTEKSHPSVDFRVGEDGNDYCSQHLSNRRS